MTEGSPLRLRRRRLSHLPLQGRQSLPAPPQIVFCCEKTLDSKQGRGYTKYTKSGRLARRFLVPPVQKRAKKVNMARMNDPREAAPCGAEGEGKNSQAKGSDQDGTSESARQRRCTPKGQPVQDRESLRFGRFFHKALPFFFRGRIVSGKAAPAGNTLCISKGDNAAWRNCSRQRRNGFMEETPKTEAERPKGSFCLSFCAKTARCASPSGGSSREAGDEGET